MARGRSDGAFTPAGPIRSAVYRLLWAIIGVLDRLSSACLYAAVGLLRTEDLGAAADARWSLFSAPDECVDAGLEPWERRLYDGVLHQSDRVLVVGCGAGRDLLPFCARGFSVTGVERVPALAMAARRHLDRHGMAAQVIAAPIETAELPPAFDVVIFSAFVYAYLADSRARISTLERLKAHLSTGGRLVLTYTDALPRPRLGLFVARLVARLTANDWTPDSEDTFTRGPARLPFYERALSSRTVCTELAAAGFQIVRDEISGTRRAVVAVTAT